MILYTALQGPFKIMILWPDRLDAMFIRRGVGRTVQLSVRYVRGRCVASQRRSSRLNIKNGRQLACMMVGVSSCCYLYSIELVARFVPQPRSR